MNRTILIVIALFITADVFAVTPAQTEAEIKDRLEQRATINLNETCTFADLFAILKDQHGIQAILDPRGAGALGITDASPVRREKFSLQEVPLRRILRLILDELDLTYVIDDGFLFITSKDEAQRHRKIRVYQVGDLIRDPDYKPGKKVWFPHRFMGLGQSKMALTTTQKPSDGHWGEMAEYDFSELMDVIETTISPDSWEEGGEMMEFYSGHCLIVLQTDEIHEEIEHLFAELRKNIAEQPKPAPTTSPKHRRPLFRR